MLEEFGIGFLNSSRAPKLWRCAFAQRGQLLRVLSFWARRSGVRLFLVFGVFVVGILSLGATDINWKKWKERQASGR